MENKRRFARVAFAIALALLSPIGAQTSSDGADKDAKGWDLAIDDAGKTVFTQFISWIGDPTARTYHLSVRKADGAAVGEYDTEETRQALRLKPGPYQYKIRAYNLLGKLENETEWTDFTVIEAIAPEVSGSAPQTIYMDEMNGRVTIRGKRIENGCTVTLRDMKTGKVYVGRELVRKEESELVVMFPDDAYNPGAYSIAVENPGGLDSVRENALAIKYQRPFYLEITAGYAPELFLFDRFCVTEAWKDTFYPLGASADIDVLFIRKPWGMAGVGVSGAYRKMTGGLPPDAALTSVFITGGLTAVFKYRITRRAFCLARAGGGLAWSAHGFSYGGAQGPTAESHDPYAQADIGAQFFLLKWLFVEAGVDANCVFFTDHFAGGIAPTVSAGVRY
jgi:hypothetical protein